eukprot:455665-Pelagomonas_calceolata.AAC.2
MSWVNSLAFNQPSAYVRHFFTGTCLSEHLSASLIITMRILFISYLSNTADAPQSALICTSNSMHRRNNLGNKSGPTCRRPLPQAPRVQWVKKVIELSLALFYTVLYSIPPPESLCMTTNMGLAKPSLG